MVKTSWIEVIKRYEHEDAQLKDFYRSANSLNYQTKHLQPKQFGPVT